MKFRLLFITHLLISFVPFFVEASGLDLTLHYGSRYVALGGQQIALVDDAYASFYNPAALNKIENGAFAINSSTLFTTYEAPIGPASTQRSSDLGLGPLFYLGGGYRLTDRIVVGLGIYPTALQGGKFSDVDYGALTDKELSIRLMRIEIAPSLSLKIVDHFAIGASYRVGYTKYEKKLGAFNGVTSYYLDQSTGALDGKGFKVGISIEDLGGFNAGLTYRFKMKNDLEGDTTLTTLAGSQSLPTNQKVEIPAQMQFGMSYDIIPQKALLAFAYEFTGNSIIDADRATYTGIGTALGIGTDNISTPLGYRDGHTFHLGGEYKWLLSRDREIRSGLGFAYDHTVTRQGKPLPATPSSAPYMGYSGGLGYRTGSHEYGLTFNYGKYSSRTTAIDADAAVGGAALTIFPGKYSTESYFVVADYQWKF